MNNLKFIYFDVGGVVLLDFSGTKKWQEMQEAMGVNPSNEARYQQVWGKYKERLSLDYDVDDMIPELKADVGLPLAADFSFLPEFIKRFNPNPAIWPVIEYAKKHYQIGLLTNMYPRMYQAIAQKTDLLPEVVWDVIVDSSVVKLQKPNPEIYQLAQKLAKVTNPAEILFVDNIEANLIYPKQMGWQTFLFDCTEPEKSSAFLSKVIINR
ncbi:MAG: HAD family hydrolase [bacterium]